MVFTATENQNRTRLAQARTQGASASDSPSLPVNRGNRLNMLQRMAQKMAHRRSLRVRIRKAHKTLHKYQHSPFLLAYALAFTADILDIFVNTFFLLASVAEFLLKKIDILIDIVKFLGKSPLGFLVKQLISFALGVGIETVLFGFFSVLTFIALIVILIRLYIAIFIWRRTTLFSRKLMSIGILILDQIPIVSLLPITVLRIRWLHSEMEKDAEKANKIIKDAGKST